ncbi:MAG: phage tail protein [Saprospiraceae bacterium]|nr:phage tail protein [Saprospiraceae bacterium]
MEGYIAEIRMFAGTFAPKYWAYCAGQILAIAQNQALFSLLGTTYGGNGVQTFGLPDLRGRTAIGTGNGNGLTPRVLGEMSGENNHTLLMTEMPAHSHPTGNGASSSAPTVSDPTGAVLASSSRSVTMPNIYSNAAANVQMGLNSVVLDPTGGGQPHTNMQPYLGMNYIICLYGIYPSRN